jgi:hypothetical protein
MCGPMLDLKKYILIVRCQVPRWGQGRKTAKKWLFWTLSCPEHGYLFAVRSPKCAPTCALSIETLFHPNWCCWVELRNRNHMTDSQKMTVQNENRPKELFWGDFCVFGWIWYGEFEFCKNFDSYVYPRYGPSKFKNEQKSEKMDQKSEVDIFVFLGNSTMKNTNFNSVLMILWSISEIRVPEYAKSTKINREWSKN